ncbi:MULTISPECIES: DUF3299 domain-containing protein [Alteromonas]|jgi:hypothetical protein|uniref:DUF3299 domain-containing protein n=2 Tax=Alteromonas stellipolaris TaxID=233316 RepID=A0AAW7YWU9_9ALTE|nr:MULTISPECIES: DUF3299 domain-containing protein [Alteromonas]ALM92724.1 hypothetical protein AOR13_3731 [Alteromonas stellipolaris LMG 21856]MDO6533635.1 DUF3299 domain-containing protein [Alteromonas stellipolaris]MDO6538438.1 DUF3299 domain-containing protein [Alteromonas stellipolaris]MDO6576865.1 DUF3299 domain-containing protein [Alteromonas stellipolaris]MDO6625371.1 DUF3299 domain-containing protein [Alteromonas stellipolaris]
MMKFFLSARIGIFVAIAGMLFYPTTYAEDIEAPDYQEVEWTQLMPEEDLAALLNPPDYLAGIEDGSQEDSVEAFGNQEFDNETTNRFQQALTSTQVVKTFENKPIRIPGFIVPLESSESKMVTEFFIVPYFGACIHMPPPPPNQIIYVSVEEGVELESLYDPFWFEGTLAIDTTENAMGTAAYRLEHVNVQPYEG